MNFAVIPTLTVCLGHLRSVPSLGAYTTSITATAPLAGVCDRKVVLPYL
jgi:hypothetical protein